MSDRAGPALLGALLVGLGAAAGAGAQEPSPTRGWLGVGVQELLECRPRPGNEKACAKKLVVTQVVLDGPADRAGVQLGDTLLVLNGSRLERGLAEPALAALRPAAAITLEVGRSGARRTLRVVPGRRPTGAVAVRVATREGARVDRRRLSATPEPAPERPERRPIVIRAEDGGVYRIQPGVQVRIDEGDGEPVVLRLRPGETVAVAEGPGALRIAAPEADEAPASRWVSLDLGPELRALQDSVFLAARSRLDSLRRALAGDERRYRALAEAMGAQRAPRHAWSFGFGRSVAGAEFEPLSPELAEFFEGPREGLVCLRVVAETPAARLGLRPGDVVVEAAGRPITSLGELRQAFQGERGGSIEVKWMRKGQPMRGVLRLE